MQASNQAMVHLLCILQVRLLLIDPAWLEVKLHCYGVAAVVDDFRTYLQVSRVVCYGGIWSSQCEMVSALMYANVSVLRLMCEVKNAVNCR